MRLPQNNPSPSLGAQAVFDGWTLDLTTGELRGNDVQRRLQEQPLQILTVLLAKPGQLVTREELIAALWPDTIVDFDAGLNTAIRKLRVALGDDPDRPRYIETLPRKGYRFIAPVGAVGESPVDATADQAGSLPQTSPSARVAARLVFPVPAALLVGALALVGLTVVDVQPTTSEPPPLAVELYMAADARQGEIAVFEGLEPRQRVLELLDRALAVAPSFAAPYATRARAKLDAFVSNVDVSSENLQQIRADLEAARKLSGDGTLGLDVRSVYAAVVDLEPERGLELADEAPSDPDALRAKAIILMSLGRYAESDRVLDGFLSLDPGNLRLLRLKASNLVVERRSGEALELLERLRRLSPAGREPRGLVYSLTGLFDAPRPALAELEHRLSTADTEAALLALESELPLLRMEQRYEEIDQLLQSTRSDSVRISGPTGALPGLGRQPLAVWRGWTAMLRGDTQAALASAEGVDAFIAATPKTPWNVWRLQMFEAEARVFSGNRSAALAAVQDSLALPLSNRHAQVYRDYLAAVVLAWAGEHAQAVALLEHIANGIPSVGPVLIAREPLLGVPLAEDAAYQGLRAALEQEIAASVVTYHRLRQR